MENPQNIELSQCLKSVTDLGQTTYVNICTNQSDVIPWGVVDWIVISLIILCLTTTIALFAWFLVYMIRNT